MLVEEGFDCSHAACADLAGDSMHVFAIQPQGLDEFLLLLQRPHANLFFRSYLVRCQ